jgi:hypothetical protein
MELDSKLYGKIKSAVTEAVKDLGKQINSNLYEYVAEEADCSFTEARAGIERMQADGSWNTL